MALKSYEKDVYICHGDKDQRYVEHLRKEFDEQGISYGYSSKKYGDKIPSEIIAILWVTRDFSKAFLESFQIITFSVWIGLVNHSVWLGVAAGTVFF